MAQVYRSPHYETLRIFYVKGDKIIAHEGLTSRLANTAVPFKNMGKGLWEMADRMKRLGADGYYLLHNHPSGRPDPSPSDVGLTKNIAAHVPGFRAHVIINHESFSSFSMEDLPFHLDHEIKNLDFRKERALDHPLIGEKVGSPGDLAWYAKQLERAPETATIIFTKRAPGKHSVVTAIQELPWKFVQSKDAAAYIRNSMKAFGAVDVFSVVENPDNATFSKLRGLYAKNLLREVLVLKGERIKSVAEEGSPLEDSMRSQRTLGIKYKDVPSLRVREQQQMYEGEGTPPTETEMGPETQGRQQPLYGDPANPNYEVSEPTSLDKVIRTFQDKYVDVRRVVESIQEAGRQVPDALNPIYKEETYQSMVMQGEKEFVNTELKPIVDRMHLAKIEQQALSDYLHARHVVTDKINARLKEMNPDIPNNDALSGMTDERAQQILAEATPAMTALGERIDAMTKKNRQLLVEYGLESQETIDAWEETYQAYVPLYREGFQETFGTGRGRDIRGSTVKDRLGSNRPVQNILASLAQDRAKTIARGEKMKPVIALAGLLAKYPDQSLAKLAKPTTITYVNPETGLETVTTDDQTTGVPTMRVKQKDGTVKTITDPMYQSRDNVVNFRLNGQQYAIVFNTQSERGMRMAEALKDLNVADLNAVAKVAQPVTRWMASVNTQYNPIFGVTNFVRDVQFAMLTLSSTELKGQRGEVLSNALGSMRGIMTELRAQRRGEQAQGDAAAWFRRFEKAGGPTGYRDLFTNTERSREIEKTLNPTKFQAAWKKSGADAVSGLLSDYNSMMENAIRMGVFRTAIDQGMSDSKAASLAKNITVNFNKKGQVSSQVGALYAFFNASVQGTARILETLVTVKGGKITGLSPQGKKIISGGILLGAMQPVLMAAAGLDEDDIPEWAKARNLILPVPGTDKGYIQLPMPLGFNVLPNLGRNAMEAILYGKPIKQAYEFLEDMFDMFSPVGGLTSPVQFLAPTAVDPLVALGENTDWSGRPIYRENMSGLDPTPGPSRSRDSATVWATALSKGINYATGGTEYQPGHFSPTADQIDYLIGQATGGVGRELSKVSQVATSFTEGTELPTYKIPLVGRFVGKASGEAQVRNRYYDIVTTMHGLKREIKGRTRAGESVKDLYQDNPLAPLAGYGVRVHQRITRLRGQRRRIQQQGGSRDAVKLMDQQINRLMKQLVDRVKGAKEAA